MMNHYVTSNKLTSHDYKIIFQYGYKFRKAYYVKLNKQTSVSHIPSNFVELYSIIFGILSSLLYIHLNITSLIQSSHWGSIAVRTRLESSEPYLIFSDTICMETLLKTFISIDKTLVLNLLLQPIDSSPLLE